MPRRVEVPLPALGDDHDDTVQSATVSGWLAELGAHLGEGDDLLEIITDKAAFVVPVPFAGTVVERRVEEGATVKVGQIIAVLET